MKYIAIILLIVFTPSKIYSQIIEFIEGYNYGGSNIEYTQGIGWALDSTIIQVGQTWSSDFDVSVNNGIADFWIINTDTNGNLLNQTSFGGSSIDYCYDFISSDDSGYYFVGYTNSVDGDVTLNHGGKDFWVIKTDGNLNLLWEKSYGGSNDEEAYSIIKTIDGNLVIAGVTLSNDGDISFNYGLSDFWVIKISPFGDLIWEKSYGGSEYEWNASVLLRSTGVITLTGDTQSLDGCIVDFIGGSDILVINISDEGLLLTSNCYGGPDFEKSVGATECNTNLILANRIHEIGGDITEFNGGFYDIWVFSLGSDGEINWQNSIGGTGSEQPYSIALIQENSILICGETQSTDGDVSFVFDAASEAEDAWVILIDTLGNIKWEKTLGGYYGDFAKAGIVSNSDIYYISNYVGSIDGMVEETFGATDIWTAKLKSCMGNIFFADMDSDGYGDPLNDTVTCNIPVGYVADSTDCDDLNIYINPFASEICNGIDDNCNGFIDDGVIIHTLYLDADSDTYGNQLIFIDTCLETLPGYVANDLDCDDANFSIYPGGVELCNYLDDNCDGIADDNLTYLHSYLDFDNDNFGDALSDSISCELPTGYVLDSTDCDDTNPDIFPGATEILNGLDDDCDQIADEGLAIQNIDNIISAISPNPSFDKINIVSNINGKGEYVIIASTGQMVLNGNWDADNNSISIIDIPTGAYTIHLLFNNNWVAHTFIKIN